MNLEDKLELLNKIKNGKTLKSSSEYTDLAKFFFEEEKFDLAADTLELAKTKNKIEQIELFRLGFIYYTINKKEKAKDIWEESIKNNIAFPETYNALSTFCKNKSKKRELFQEAKEKELLNEIGYQQLAEVSKNEDEKLKICKEARKKNLANESIYIELIRKEKNIDIRLELEEEAIINNKTTPSIYLLNLIDLQNTQQEKKLVERLYETVEEYSTNKPLLEQIIPFLIPNDFNKIIELLEQIKQDKDFTPTLFNQLLYSYVNTNSVRKAEKLIKEGEEEKIIQSSSYQIISKMYNQSNNKEKELTALEKATQFPNCDDHTIQTLAMNYLINKNNKKALDLIKKVSKKSENSYPTLYIKAHAENALKDYKTSLATTQKARELNILEPKLATTLIKNMFGTKKSDDEILQVAKELDEKNLLTEKTKIEVQTLTASNMNPGSLEQAIKEDKLTKQNYFELIQKLELQDKKEEVERIATIAKKRNKLNLLSAEIIASKYFKNRNYQKGIDWIIPYKNELQDFMLNMVLGAYRELGQKDKISEIGEEILSNKYTGRINGTTLSILHDNENDKRYFDALNNYANKHPTEIYNFAALATIASRMKYTDFDKTKVLKKITNTLKEKKELHTLLKPQEKGTCTIKEFEKFPYKNTIFIKQKKEPHTDEIKYLKKIKKIIKDVSPLVKTPEFIDTFKQDGEYFYITSFERGARLTSVIDGTIENFETWEALEKFNIRTYDLDALNGLVLNIIAELYVNLPEEQLQLYDFRSKLAEKGYEKILIEACEPFISILDNSDYTSYFNDSWSDNWMVGKEGLTLIDTENRGRVAIGADAGHYLTHIGQGHLYQRLNASAYLLNRINERGKENGRIITDSNQFFLEFEMGSVLRALLNSRSRGTIEKRYVTAHGIATAGIEMIQYINKNFSNNTMYSKNHKIIEEVLYEEQQKYKNLFYEKQQREQQIISEKYPGPKDPKIEAWLEKMKDYQLYNHKKRRSEHLKAFYAGFVNTNNISENEKKELQAYINSPWIEPELDPELKQIYD